MSCAGDPYVNTPHLDELVASGIRFENAYAANAVCVPSRYSMISGYMPHVFDGLETNRKTTKAKPTISDFIDTPTLGTIFKDAGYDVLYGGKLHVEGNLYYHEDLESVFDFTALTANARMELAEKAVKAFKQNRDKPFLMWASYINPHDICYFPHAERNSAAYKKQKIALKELHEANPDIPLPPLPENYELADDEIA